MTGRGQRKGKRAMLPDSLHRDRAESIIRDGGMGMAENHLGGVKETQEWAINRCCQGGCKGRDWAPEFLPITIIIKGVEHV